jgi:hypothetical protein
MECEHCQPIAPSKGKKYKDISYKKIEDTIMVVPSTKGDWELKYDLLFNKNVVVMGDYLFEDIKSFIRQLLASSQHDNEIQCYFDLGNKTCKGQVRGICSEHINQLTSKVSYRQKILKEIEKQLQSYDKSDRVVLIWTNIKDLLIR